MLPAVPDRAVTPATIRSCDEWEHGAGWIENGFLERCSHALVAGGVWVVDPVDGDGVEARIRALGEPAGVVQTLDRHGRDCAELARRLAVPHLAVPREPPPGAPFRVLPVLRAPGWREVALWWPSLRTLVVGDALGTATYFRAPGERLAVHPLLRLLPPRRLRRLEPEHVLCGHGEGLHGAQSSAELARALATARRRLPQAWLSAFRRGRS